MDYIALTTYMLVMIITPGPNNMMVTASGANFGYRATVAHLWGICCGCALQAAICCLGLGAIFIKFPVLQTILLWIGLAYMLYLCWKLLGIKIGEEKPAKRPLALFEAAIFQMVNPKAWMISLTIASVFLPRNGSLIWPVIIIIIFEISLTYIGTSIWTLFGQSLRHLLRREKSQRIFNYIMAALLLITAIIIAL